MHGTGSGLPSPACAEQFLARRVIESHLADFRFVFFFTFFQAQVLRLRVSVRLRIG